MFDMTNKKMGLNQALLGTEGFGKKSPKMSFEEIDTLLKRGALYLYSNDEETDERIEREMLDEDVDSILSRATTITYDQKSGVGYNSSFSIDDGASLNDKDFWVKLFRGSLKSPATLKKILSNAKELANNNELRTQYFSDVGIYFDRVVLRNKNKVLISEAKELLDMIESKLTLSRPEKRSISNLRTELAKIDPNKTSKVEEVPIRTSCTTSVTKYLTRFGFGRWNDISAAVLKQEPNTKLNVDQIRSLSENIVSAILREVKEDKENSKKSKHKSSSKKGWKASMDPLLARFIVDTKKNIIGDILASIQKENPKEKVSELNISTSPSESAMDLDLSLKITNLPDVNCLSKFTVSACQTIKITAELPPDSRCYFLIQLVKEGTEQLFARQIRVKNEDFSFVVPGLGGSYEGQMYRLESFKNEKAQLVPIGNTISFRVRHHSTIRIKKIDSAVTALENMRCINNLVNEKGTELKSVTFDKLKKSPAIWWWQSPEHDRLFLSSLHKLGYDSMETMFTSQECSFFSKEFEEDLRNKRSKILKEKTDKKRSDYPIAPTADILDDHLDELLSSILKSK